MNAQGRLFTADTFANLPFLFEGETLYSWAGAAHLSNPNPDARETSRCLYGSPRAAMLHDFPSHIDTLSSNLGGAIGTPNVLALRHSLLGYFLPARPPDFVAGILRAIKIGPVGGLKFQLGLPASRIGGHHPLKGCPMCFDQQVNRHGRAYWLVGHQLPSVFCCVEHDEMLQVAWTPAAPVQRRGWVLPLGGLSRQWCSYPLVNDAQFQCLRRLATFSARWAQQQPSSFDGMRLALTYRTALHGHGLITQGGSLRLAEAVRLLRQSYSGLDGFEGLSAIRSSDASWSTLIGSASRRVPRPCHPLKHLLLICMLFPTWDEFITAYEAAAGEAVAEAPAAATRTTEQTAQGSFSELVKNQGLSISAAGRRVGISTTTAVRWAKVIGLGYTARAKTYTQDRLEEARELLRQGASKVQVVEQLGFSVGAVNRLISSEPHLAVAWRVALHERARQANRERFSEALAQVLCRPLKEIRATPGSGYAWLYRHDRAWLTEKLPFFGDRAL